MDTFDDLQKYRERISDMLRIATDGEITNFDFIIDFLTKGGRPGIVTILLGVPSKVKREYDFDMNALLDKHEDTIRQVISASGFPDLFKRTIHYQIL
jgi:hypothetical protein